MTKPYGYEMLPLDDPRKQRIVVFLAMCCNEIELKKVFKGFLETLETPQNIPAHIPLHTQHICQ